MSYIFKGKLWDKTESTLEPLSDVMIRLYQSKKSDSDSNNPSSLIAESKTDANGNFVIEIKDYHPNEQELKVDILCERNHSHTSHLHPKINFKSMIINPGRAKLKMESFRMGTITFLSIFSAA